jgi:hypothetical protein
VSNRARAEAATENWKGKTNTRYRVGQIPAPDGSGTFDMAVLVHFVRDPLTMFVSVRSRNRLPIAVAIALCSASPGPASAQTSDPIPAGYMRLYAGHREEAQTYFDRLRAQDPRALAPWFGALSVQMASLEEGDPAAAQFERDIDAFIDRASDRKDRSSEDTEALFYLAQAYLLRGTFRLDHDKGLWGAARDAAKSKGYADQYIKRHPEHADAYLTLGLYNYYADIAPNFVKVLRILLLLPSGNRAEGMKQLERVAREGTLFAPFAEMALADILGSYEGRLADAIPLAQKFVQRFPDNADMRLELAAMYLHPTVEDYSAAAEQYTTVLTSAREPTVRQLSEKYRAQLGLANVRRSQWRIDDAITLLSQALDEHPSKPAWVVPTLLLQRANYRMLRNDPSAADDARRVLADAAMSKWHKAARQQVTAIDERRKTHEGTIYWALVAGNRFVADRRFDDARAVYERVGATYPADWQVRYRLAYLEFARGQYAVAGAQFQEIVASPARMPAWLKAAALLHLAWTHDLAGRRADALKLYKLIVDDYENEAAAAAARLGLIAPYRGRPSAQARPGGLGA